MVESAAQDVQMSRNVHGRTSVAEDIQWIESQLL